MKKADVKSVPRCVGKNVVWPQAHAKTLLACLRKGKVFTFCRRAGSFPLSLANFLFGGKEGCGRKIFEEEFKFC
jgi:hypothetical protein